MYYNKLIILKERQFTIMKMGLKRQVKIIKIQKDEKSLAFSTPLIIFLLSFSQCLLFLHFENK